MCFCSIDESSRRRRARQDGGVFDEGTQGGTGDDDFFLEEDSGRTSSSKGRRNGREGHGKRQREADEGESVGDLGEDDEVKCPIGLGDMPGNGNPFGFLCGMQGLRYESNMGIFFCMAAFGMQVHEVQSRFSSVPA